MNTAGVEQLLTTAVQGLPSPNPVRRRLVLLELEELVAPPETTLTAFIRWTRLRATRSFISKAASEPLLDLLLSALSVSLRTSLAETSSNTTPDAEDRVRPLNNAYARHKVAETYKGSFTEAMVVGALADDVLHMPYRLANAAVHGALPSETDLLYHLLLNLLVLQNGSADWVWQHHAALLDQGGSAKAAILDPRSPGTDYSYELAVEALYRRPATAEEGRLWAWVGRAVLSGLRSLKGHCRDLTDVVIEGNLAGTDRFDFLGRSTGPVACYLFDFKVTPTHTESWNRPRPSGPSQKQLYTNFLSGTAQGGVIGEIHCNPLKVEACLCGPIPVRGRGSQPLPSGAAALRLHL